MPTPEEELLKAFERIGNAPTPRPGVPRGGIPSANELARRFQALEEAAGVRPLSTATAETAQPLTQRPGLLQRAANAYRAWRTPAAAASAVEATKAAATAATSEVAKKSLFTKLSTDLVTGQVRRMPRFLGRIVPAAAAAQALGGAALSLGANRTLSDAQRDPVRLLRRYGMEVERGTDETGAQLGLADAYQWYTGLRLSDPIGTAERIWKGEGDPNWTDPRSDVNQLRVFTPEGQEITGGMSNELAAAQMKRQADMFRAAGLMKNRIRAERGLPPVYSPTDLMRNARKK